MAQALHIDTLAFMESMKASGMDERQAAALARNIGEIDTTNLATKADIADVRREIGDVKSEIKEDIAQVRNSVVGLSEAMKVQTAEIKAEIAGLKTEIAGLEAKFWVKQFASIAVLVGLLAILGWVFRLYAPLAAGS